MAIENGGKRLNKLISDTGICSRREADRLIDEGLVKVNGQIATTGLKIGPDDRVTVRGKPLKAKPEAVYLLYNKPAGITCTTDEDIVDNIIAAVNYRGGRIFPVGRLDKPSEGLILLTNDGDSVNKILRAGNAHEKEYVVTVNKPFSQDFINKMAAGIPILGTKTKPCQVRQVAANTFNIILVQGLNRQIRRMTEYLGYEVVRLKRVRVMNLRIAGLKTGQWRLLNAKEILELESMLASSSKTTTSNKTKKPNSLPATRQKTATKATAGKRTPPNNTKHAKTAQKPGRIPGRSGPPKGVKSKKSR